MLKEIIEKIAKSIVDHPEMVTVKEVEGVQTSVIELKVAKEDIGKIIGKEGRNAKSIRTILNAVGNKLKKRVHLEIVE